MRHRPEKSAPSRRSGAKFVAVDDACDDLRGSGLPWRRPPSAGPGVQCRDRRVPRRRGFERDTKPAQAIGRTRDLSPDSAERCELDNGWAQRCVGAEGFEPRHLPCKFVRGPKHGNKRHKAPRQATLDTTPISGVVEFRPTASHGTKRKRSDGRSRHQVFLSQPVRALRAVLETFSTSAD